MDISLFQGPQGYPHQPNSFSSFQYLHALVVSWMPILVHNYKTSYSSYINYTLLFSLILLCISPIIQRDWVNGERDTYFCAFIIIIYFYTIIKILIFNKVIYLKQWWNLLSVWKYNVWLFVFNDFGYLQAGNLSLFLGNTCTRLQPTERKYFVINNTVSWHLEIRLCPCAICVWSKREFNKDERWSLSFYHYWIEALNQWGNL